MKISGTTAEEMLSLQSWK